MKLFLFVTIIAVMAFSAVLTEECPPECKGCESKAEGEEWNGRSTKGCHTVTCQKKDGHINFFAVGCSWKKVPPNCKKVEGDEKLDYPACCPKIKC